ncbi:MAG: hypothetical protein ACU0DI_13635 [Paracoccaceae bacterium]
MWKLGKIHKVGELVAALAVVVSLLFVAFEIQKSNQTQVQANTRAVVGEWTEKMRPITTAPGFACIYANGMVNYLALSGEDKLKFSSFIMAIMYAWEEIQYLAGQGAIEQRIWRGIDSAIGEVAHLPGFQQWFETRRHWYSNGFQDYIDNWMKKAPPFDPVIFADDSCVPVEN